MTNKLTDLELCKRIAVIEGFETKIVKDTLRVGFTIGSSPIMWGDFESLTNKALLFDLMVKYGAEIDYDDMTCSIYHDESLIAASTTVFKSKEDLPRAILECIMEASE